MEDMTGLSEDERIALEEATRASLLEQRQAKAKDNTGSHTGARAQARASTQQRMVRERQALREAQRVAEEASREEARIAEVMRLSAEQERREAERRQREQEANLRQMEKAQQEQEFQESLARDQERAAAEKRRAEEEAAAEAARIDAQEEAAELEAAQALSKELSREQTLAALAGRAAPEPAEGSPDLVDLAFRMPDGSRVSRKFDRTATVSQLRDFVDHSGLTAHASWEVGKCDISTTFPKTVLTETPQQSLADAGLAGRALLNVDLPA